MNEHAYRNWTQEGAAHLPMTDGHGNGLAALLRLAREDEASLKADLADVSAARAAAARSVFLSARNAPENAARLSAVRRLLECLERSERDICDRLMEARADADRLAGLLARFHGEARRELTPEGRTAVRCG